MHTRNSILALAAAAAFGLPAAADARPPTFSYLEANYVNVNVDDVDPFTFRRGSRDGFQLGASAQVWEMMHLFGEYSQAGQDLEFDTDLDDGLIEGDFDLIRWRVGVGVHSPVDEMISVYGRVSWDSIEFDGLATNGVILGDRDDGFGAEVGAIVAPIPQVHLQGYVRYTSVGEIDALGQSYDDDYLFGAEARWFLTENFALQAGYEYGEITTWNAGVRFAF
jgi:hypothetical protein